MANETRDPAAVANNIEGLQNMFDPRAVRGNRSPTRRPVADADVASRPMTRPPTQSVPPKALAAVLFDMDGVVTDTANVHAAVWKRLFDDYLAAVSKDSSRPYRPFDADHDYRTYVDGRARYDGVRSFLESRHIRLSEGLDGDSPDTETVRGLGNRKNEYFLEHIAREPPTPFASTVRLIDALRAAGVRIALFSASSNATDILARSGIVSLFDTIVDGNDLAAAGLPGKPDPAILFEAAGRLGATPGDTAVVEDAIAGIEAGVRGEFGLVIGIARGGYAGDLAAAGAHIVVHDASELIVTASRTLVPKTLANIPAVCAGESAILQRLRGRSPAVFLDYDGTLTPIVEDYTQAFLEPGMRETLRSLARKCPLAVVSGRDLDDLRKLVDLEDVYYAGSHGFDIAGPEGTRDSLEKGRDALPAIAVAERRLHTRLADVPGHAVERKRFSIAVHFRRAAAADEPRIERIVDEVVGAHPGLRKATGKKVFEILPDIVWDKGCAVLWLLERLGLDEPGFVPVYIGDDVTDEFAFRALAGRGLTLVVHGENDNRVTAADFGLDNIEAVRHFLTFLITNADAGAVAPSRR